MLRGRLEWTHRVSDTYTVGLLRQQPPKLPQNAGYRLLWALDVTVWRTLQRTIPVQITDVTNGPQNQKLTAVVMVLSCLFVFMMWFLMLRCDVVCWWVEKTTLKRWASYQLKRVCFTHFWFRKSLTLAPSIQFNSLMCEKRRHKT